MIDLDSPVASVLGAQTKQGKAKKITDGLGLRTVGDLLHHFPRRYVQTGELTKVDELHEGEMLTVVGEITESELHQYQDRRTHRPAYRLDTTLSTDGPSLRMSFFAKAKHVSDWHAGRLPVGRRGIFIGQVSNFRGQWQLTNPTMVLFGVDDSDETFGAAVASIKALFPLYPLTKGVDSWDLQRAIAFALTVVDEVVDPLPAGLRSEHDLPDLMTAFRHVHAPDSWAQVNAAQRRFRFDEALVTQLVLARRRAALAQLGGQARTGGGGLLAAFDERLPFTLTRGQEEVSARDRGRPRAAAPDEPPAPGRGRLRQDARRAPRDAPGRRLRRPGRAAGADRGARPAAPAVDHRDARRPRRRRDARRPRRCHDGRAADRLDAEGGADRGDAPGGERARPGS